MGDQVIIGLAGITATLISSGLGLYFTAKARSASLRETLYNKQLELITKIVHEQGRFRIFATILSDSEDAFKELAREDIGLCVRDFSVLEEEGAAILPVELWVEVRQLFDQMTSILKGYDNGSGIAGDDMREYVSRCTKVALISRMVLGVDELTEESIKLFSSKKKYKELTEFEIKELEAIYKQENA